MKMEPNTKYNILKRYEGFVESLGNDSFIARLIDMDGKEPDLEAEIYLSKVPDIERDHVKVGAVFYWDIGCRERKGILEDVSIITFHQLTPATQEKIDSAHSKAKELSDKIRWW